MYSFQTVEIAGYRNEPVPNTFIRQEGPAEHIAIALPGIGYGCQMPMLYYPSRWLLDHGADVLWVEYAYLRWADYGGMTSAEKGQVLLADTTAACRAALAQRSYKRVTVLGKSLGTLAMGHLLTAEPALAQARAIWLTPLLQNVNLRSQMQHSRQPALIVVGAADSHYDRAALEQVQSATQAQTVLVDGADHSLEIPGDLWRSLQALEQVMHAVETFIYAAIAA